MKTVIAFLMFGVAQLAAQDTRSCPMHKEHMKDAAQHQGDVDDFFSRARPGAVRAPRARRRWR